MKGIKESDLIDMSREELIEWLCWNDRNGCYRDEESIGEMGTIMTYEEAYETALSQINE
jgi:hypothetical protein